jgi:hypothetical protein
MEQKRTKRKYYKSVRSLAIRTRNHTGQTMYKGLCQVSACAARPVQQLVARFSDG